MDNGNPFITKGLFKESSVESGDHANYEEETMEDEEQSGDSLPDDDHDDSDDGIFELPRGV